MTIPKTLQESLTTTTPAQAVAVCALASGATHAEAAAAAGVRRETVSRWCSHHPGVKAALLEARAALAEEQAIAVSHVRSRALGLIDRSLTGIEAALEADRIDPLAALKGILPLASLADLPSVQPLDARTLLDVEAARRGKPMDFEEVLADRRGEAAMRMIRACEDGSAEPE